MEEREKTGGQDVEGWLKEHGDYLYRYAYSRLSDVETARDMVQETLIAAWKANFKGDSSVRTWLVGIMKHKIIDHIRKEIRKRNLHESAESDPTSHWFNADGSWQEAPRAWADNPEELSENSQFREVLFDCIGKLPEKQRSAFSMRELAGEDSDTVCNEMDITPTNLHVMMHRARMALRSCLDMHWFGGSKAS
ncbi:MAG: RNA polymerase subunit sigma-70 [Zetaproteobacteria bacterium CG12_big_fil_rev_8_21_14_0_65_55_1124]|nr:MAG: RNA polymerase subunit sigma-70 [Zetaproteobacteria bacterium CG1_02_55_237]PIS19142.1 MAG: RNA polymerase subunit sigma-70 [Zetaproteobacteria bacterium CG08_land_8_20_14_0_20_55_17]PIW43838.1 MAG: RNA polymerase subunit sigma-70 [Zetaproteobacteria bacterium CG12_big_fil_rev_8_21_14_0_65_55_1124]PIY52983.1 MAG: RNA polymerase subunit sigma-70 [Zetaproteobacteria bacterium CG_4_10_14_0_8_um_filter_55_43]PIZ37617.1 MAG: RNA polymerase subunit sigma-70 [Zetaproteobacteria bacterium CG_4_